MGGLNGAAEPAVSYSGVSIWERPFPEVFSAKNKLERYVAFIV